MSAVEEDEWTTVVNSKSRPRPSKKSDDGGKPVRTRSTFNWPGEGGGGGEGAFSPAKKTSLPVARKTFTKGGGGAYNQRMKTNRDDCKKGFPGHQPATTSTSEQPLIKSTNRKVAEYIKDAEKITSRKPPLPPSSVSASSLRTKPIVVAPPQITQTRKAAGSGNQYEPKATTSSTLPATSVSGAQKVTTTGPGPPKRKKKKESKEQRRKKQEEKFYQALYQNKDSHIQFVTADMVRQLQNPGYQSSLHKSFTVKPRPDHGPVTHPLPSTSSRPLCSETDFPSLTPTSRVEAAPEKAQQMENSDVVVTAPTIQKSTNEAEAMEEKSDTCSSMTANNAPSNSKSKKSKQPMVIDISTLIVDKKKDKESEKKFITITSGKGASKDNHKLTAGNPLDSSGPGVIHRGKIREKKKKPNKLKLTILKSRVLRKILLEEKTKQEKELATESKTRPSSTTNNIRDGDINGGSKFVEHGDLSIQSESERVLGTVSELEVSSVTSTFLTTQSPPSQSGDRPEDEKYNNMVLSCQGGDSHESTTLPSSSSPKAGDANVTTCATTDSTNVQTSEPKVESVSVEEAACSTEADVSAQFLKLLDEISVMKIDQTISPEVEIAVKSAMHNRKFRDYCDMYTSKELHRQVVQLLTQLYRFQDKLYHTEPIKFKTKRRFVIGIKEALTYLSLSKVQLLIIAPDIEKVPEPGGLDEKISQILAACKGRSVPYVFSSTKYNLGKAIRIKTPVSIVAVLDYQSCEETLRALLEEASHLREKYRNDFLEKVEQLMGGSTNHM